MSELPPVVTRFVGDARPLIAATAEARAAVKAYAEETKRYSAEQTATVRESQKLQADEVRRYQAEQAATVKRYQAEQVASTRQYTAEQTAGVKRFSAEQVAAQRTTDGEKAAELARFQAEEKASTARYQAEQLAATRRYAAEQNAQLRAQLAEQRSIQRKHAEESDAQKAITKVVGGSPIGGMVGGEAMMGLGPVGMAIGATAVVLGAVTLGITAVGVESLKMAANYESATTRLLTSAGESHDKIEMVRQGMLDMSAQVGVSAQDLAKAMYTVESGTFHGADALKVLRAAVEGAKAENADLTAVTNATTTALVDYHLGADQAAFVTTKMVAATSAGKTTFEELTGAMHSVLPNASAAKISLEDILGSLAAMTVHGMSAQQAAQNLNDVIRHMQAPTAIQAKELALLGMTTNQLADDLKTKGLSGTLQEISDRIKKLSPPGTDKVILDLKTALNGLSPAVREVALSMFDGHTTAKDYAAAAKALDPISQSQAMSFKTLAGSMHRIGDEQMTGAQVIQNYGQALYKATGDATGLNVALMLTGDNAGVANTAVQTVKDATVEAGNHVKGWSDIQGTLNQQLQEFKAGVEALGIKIGDKLMPTVKEIIQDFKDFAKKVSETFDRPEIHAALDHLSNAFDKMSKERLKDLKKDLDDLAKFIDKNHTTIERFINFIANDVMPVLGFLIKWGIRAMLSAFALLIEVVHLTQDAFDIWRHAVITVVESVVAAVLGNFDALLWGFDKLIQKTPGVPDSWKKDLDKAHNDFHAFVGKTLSDIDSLDGHTVTMNVNTVYHDPGYHDANGNLHRGAIQFRAEGGPVLPGQPYVVGEHGPELVQFTQPGHVFTASETRQILSGGSDGGARFSAPRGGGGGGSGGEPIVIQLVADGRKLYEVIVPHAQRHKGRNPNTALV